MCGDLSQKLIEETYGRHDVKAGEGRSRSLHQLTEAPKLGNHAITYKGQSLDLNPDLSAEQYKHMMLLPRTSEWTRSHAKTEPPNLSKCTVFPTHQNTMKMTYASRKI